MPPPPPRSPSTNPTEPPSPDCRSTSVTSKPAFRAAPRPRTPGRSGGAGVQGRGAGDWIFRPLGRQTQGLGQPGRTSAICWKATALWGYVAARTSKQQALLRLAIVPALFELYDCFQNSRWVISFEGVYVPNGRRAADGAHEGRASARAGARAEHWPGVGAKGASPPARTPALCSVVRACCSCPSCAVVCVRITNIGYARPRLP